jgi:hypothetical protein
MRSDGALYNVAFAFESAVDSEWQDVFMNEVRTAFSPWRISVDDYVVNVRIPLDDMKNAVSLIQNIVRNTNTQVDELNKRLEEQFNAERAREATEAEEIRKAREQLKK